MKQCNATVILSLGLLVLTHLPAAAQPLPHIRLRPAFPQLTLDRPVGMCQAPDGSDRRFIVEQTGRILIIPGGSDGSSVKEFLNITERKPFVDLGANTHVGLISVAFHPGYKTNGLFYIFYAQTNANPTGQFPRRNVISEFKVSATDPDRADPASERVVLEVPEPFNSNQGGELGFGPDG